MWTCLSVDHPLKAGSFPQHRPPRQSDQEHVPLTLEGRERTISLLAGPTVHSSGLTLSPSAPNQTLAPLGPLYLCCPAHPCVSPGGVMGAGGDSSPSPASGRRVDHTSVRITPGPLTVATAPRSQGGCHSHFTGAFHNASGSCPHGRKVAEGLPEAEPGSQRCAALGSSLEI